MKIEILGTESLGVRSLSCYVETENRKILIDPGIALGYIRHGLLPHPLQVAVDERVQKRIVDRWEEATDIVISHFHGDHVPLVDANPYQLNVEKITGLNPPVRIWTKDPSSFSPLEKERAESLSHYLNKDLRVAEEIQGAMTFSKPVPHGEANDNSETVIMTKIEADKIFVHASDIQLLNNEAIAQILYWKPDIVLAGGPPLYLSAISAKQIGRAWHNAKRLAQKVGCLILDHHLMRSSKGIGWLKRLSETEKSVMCGADFMRKPRRLLEARRGQLYADMPVPPGWHDAYAVGKAKPPTHYYWNKAKTLYKNLRLGE